MSIKTVAGHHFVDAPGGEKCEWCGKTWMSVLQDREFWKPGEPNIAHGRNLWAADVTELEAKIEAMWKAGAGA